MYIAKNDLVLYQNLLDTYLYERIIKDYYNVQ